MCVVAFGLNLSPGYYHLGIFSNPKQWLFNCKAPSSVMGLAEEELHLAERHFLLLSSEEV